MEGNVFTKSLNAASKWALRPALVPRRPRAGRGLHDAGQRRHRRVDDRPARAQRLLCRLAAKDEIQLKFSQFKVPCCILALVGHEDGFQTGTKPTTFTLARDLGLNLPEISLITISGITSSS
jgi:hypothetical protein